MHTESRVPFPAPSPAFIEALHDLARQPDAGPRRRYVWVYDERSCSLVRATIERYAIVGWSVRGPMMEEDAHSYVVMLDGILDEAVPRPPEA